MYLQLVLKLADLNDVLLSELPFNAFLHTYFNICAILSIEDIYYRHVFNLHTKTFLLQ